MRYLLLLFLLASCSSAKKYAIKLSEQGLHEAALAKWIEASDEDPDDVEVQVGLRICQDKVVNERLVKIRDLRNAKDYAQAQAVMRDLIHAEEKWKIKLDFNSSNFQGNEVSALWGHHKLKIADAVLEKRPLFAYKEFAENEKIYQSMRDFATVRSQIFSSGTEKCKVLKKTSKKRPFFTSFTSQFCKFFDAGRSLSSTPTSLSESVFGTIELTTKVTSTDLNLDHIINTHLTSAFKDTPWFHPEGRQTLKVAFDVDYQWTPRSYPVRLVHHYMEQVPYTEYVSVTKSREVEYETTKRHCQDNGTGSQTCLDVPVTKTKTEYYTDSEPVTRYRDEPRTLDYDATRHINETKMIVKGSTKTAEGPILVSFSKQEKEEKYLFDSHFPAIGLFAQKEPLKNSLQKFEDYAKESALTFASQMNDAWIKDFCVLPNSQDNAAIGENILKCRRAKNYPEVVVETWFNNHFGVTSKYAESVIGQF